MTKATTLKRQITDAQTNLKALQRDRPKITALLDKHTAQLAAAKREGVDLEQLAELAAKQDAFALVLAQHDRDIELLEADIENLQMKFDLQTTGERFAAVKAHHEALLPEYRDAVRDSLNAVQNTLSAQLKKRSEIEATRAELEHLGLKLGVFQQSTRVMGPVLGTGFRPLWPSAVLGLFDTDYPELRTDKTTLELLGHIADVDEVVQSGELRTVLANREATRQAQIRESVERHRAEVSAALEAAAQ